MPPTSRITSVIAHPIELGPTTRISLGVVCSCAVVLGGAGYGFVQWMNAIHSSVTRIELKQDAITSKQDRMEVRQDRFEATQIEQGKSLAVVERIAKMAGP